MKMKRILIVLMMMTASTAFAQTLEEAKKMLYYERYESAAAILDKVVAANPGNTEAVYYLAQVFIAFDKPAAAKAILSKADANDPMIMVGLGHIDLIEGKVNEARMKFETAISVTKGKNKNVLNAIAVACVDAKAGDPSFIVDKFKLALANENKNPEYFVTLGDCYRKLLDGTNAVINYQRALEIQPNYAAALYKMGRVYKTQGNKEIFLAKYDEALKADPNYAPVLYELYSYWYGINVNTATDYFNLYKKVADQGPKLDYEEASLLYASKRFDDAIARAKQLQSAEGANADNRLNKLLAYSYFQKGDSLNAKAYFEAYFSKENPDKIVCDNYATYADVLVKIKGNEDRAEEYYNKAINCDTVVSNKVDYIRKIAMMYKNMGNQMKYGEYMLKALSMVKIISKTDLYYTGLAMFQTERYNTCDSIFGIYAQRWPNEIYGHYYQALSKWRIDSTMAMGTSNTHWFKYIEVAQKDSNANKRGLITAYNYFVGYNINVIKNKDSALYYATRMLWLDPTNKDAEYYIKVLSTKSSGAPAKPSKPAGSKTGAIQKKSHLKKVIEA
jgi:tetratricopeptide (TPR) repeat protein